MAQLDLRRAAAIFWRELCCWCGCAHDDTVDEWRVGIFDEWNSKEEAGREGERRGREWRRECWGWRARSRSRAGRWAAGWNAEAVEV